MIQLASATYDDHCQRWYSKFPMSQSITLSINTTLSDKAYQEQSKCLMNDWANYFSFFQI